MRRPARLQGACVQQRAEHRQRAAEAGVRPAADKSPALIGCVQAQDHPHRGGLADAVGMLAEGACPGQPAEAMARPRQLRFRPPLRVTTAAFDPHRNGIGSSQKEGAWWIGDYQGITASAGAFHLVWNDTRTGKLDLYAATVHP